MKLKTIIFGRVRAVILLLSACAGAIGLPMPARAEQVAGTLSASVAFSDANWNGLGAWVSGADQEVRASVLDDEGNLYIGGDFTRVGDIAANHVAKWDGERWYPIGSGIDGQVFALAISGTNLYAAGVFSSAGGVPVKNIAKWNGYNWAPLGTGVDGPVYVLEASERSLCGRTIHQGWRGSSLFHREMEWYCVEQSW